jgi:hypothetical protein
METVTTETRPANPVVEAAEGATPGLGTSVVLVLRAEAWVNPLPGASTYVVGRDEGPIRRTREGGVNGN